MYAITLNGNSSNLSCDFFPPIEVSKDTNICLLSLQTNNYISNITEQWNQIEVLHRDSGKNLVKDMYICTISTS